MEVMIKKGGYLLESTYNEEKQAYEHTKDVTPYATRYLFDSCKLDDDITLRDIFLLINRDIEIYDAILQNHTKEFVEECLASPIKAAPVYGVENVEYLSIYKTLSKDADGLHGFQRPDLSGMGFVMEEDYFTSGYLQTPKGERTRYAVSMSNCGDYSETPVKLLDTLVITNDDLDHEDWGKVIATYKNPEYTMGEIFNAIIWELSFYGPPEKRAAFKEELMGYKEDAMKQMDEELLELKAE
jgi:hypothetical protein